VAKKKSISSWSWRILRAIGEACILPGSSHFCQEENEKGEEGRNSSRFRDLPGRQKPKWQARNKCKEAIAEYLPL
jgi:hypothetical protein